MTTQMKPDTSAEERGWLCELQDGGSPTWWTPLGADGGEWVTEASKALRFAREVDAEVYIEEAGWTAVIPTEHIWSGGRALADAAGKAAPTHEASIGVGDGSGQLFVHGSYEAIKRVQAFIFDAESYRKLGHTRTGEEAPVPPPVEGLETTLEHRTEWAKEALDDVPPDYIFNDSKEIVQLLRDFDRLAKEVERLKAKYEPGHTDLMVSPETIDEALAGEAVPVLPPVDGPSAEELRVAKEDVAFLVAETGRLAKVFEEGFHHKMDAIARAEGLAKEVEETRARKHQIFQMMRDAEDRCDRLQAKLAVYEAPIGDIAGDEVTLSQATPGLFLFEREGRRSVGLKTEYRTPKGQVEAYVAESGEFFWGGAKTFEERASLVVREIDYDDLLRRLSAAHAECKEENTKLSPPWTMRLARIDQRTAIERQASNLKAAIEALGAHPLLTDALRAADLAMCTLGKWHDEGEPGGNQA